MRIAVVLFLAVAVALGGLAPLLGQERQRFRVQVPSHMTVAAPTPLVVLTHDETGNDQVFARQQWAVRANLARGATVSFTTHQPFTNGADATRKRDARLELSVASADAGAGWVVDIAQDQTNHAAGDEVATVRAQSHRAGSAAFDLTVTFLADSKSPLAPPDYETSITATLTAN